MVVVGGLSGYPAVGVGYRGDIQGDCSRFCR